MFNRAFRVIAEEHGLTLVEEARLFAMIDLAGADSVINCWNDKAFFSFWRPITAIHEGDNDETRTVGDAGWTPFVAATPPYPDHTSGYNCVSSGMMHTAKLFFGDNGIDFTLTTASVSPGPTNGSRTSSSTPSTPGCGRASTSAPPMSRARRSARTSPTTST